MFPELGHLSLIIALCLAILLAVVPLLGAARSDQLWMGYARPLAWGQFFFRVIYG